MENHIIQLFPFWKQLPAPTGRITVLLLQGLKSFQIEIQSKMK